MDRRSFLRSLGLGLPGVPAVVAALAQPPEPATDEMYVTGQIICPLCNFHMYCTRDEHGKAIAVHPPAFGDAQCPNMGKTWLIPAEKLQRAKDRHPL